MPAHGGSTRSTKIHVQDKDFTLFVGRRGVFTVLVPTGRYTEALLGFLVHDFLNKPDFLAVDLSKLDAVTLTLVRALCEYGGGLGPGAGRMILVNPPEKIRGLVKLVGGEGKLTMTFSARDLEGELTEVDDRIRRSYDRLHLVRTMLASHPCWQLADRESRWLCPFCVTLRPRIRFMARGTPTPACVEGVLRHLSEECTTYLEGATDGWPFEVLERVIRHANGEDGVPLSGAVVASEDPSQESKVRRKAGLDATPVDERRQRMLPRSAPLVAAFGLEVYYRGAEPLSGDFYDFVRLSEGRVGLILGDVSGHGVDPAILMGAARKALALRLKDCENPARALAKANDDLCEDLDQESHVTAVVAVLDGNSRSIVMARAGHAGPILLREGATSRLGSPGPVLGFVPTTSFEEQGYELENHALKSGDILVFHSDGFEQLRNDAEEKFGPDRLGVLLRAHSAQEAHLILGALILEAEQFAGSQERPEDITAICLKVR
jgi:serine phosphatase RsbU (regulator of sigma subunit)